MDVTTTSSSYISSFLTFKHVVSSRGKGYISLLLLRAFSVEYSIAVKYVSSATIEGLIFRHIITRSAQCAKNLC